MPPPNIFAKRLYQLRLLLGERSGEKKIISQGSLGQMVNEILRRTDPDHDGPKQATISEWESAKDPNKGPRLQEILALCELSGWSADYLLGLSEQEQPLRPGQWILDQHLAAIMRTNKRKKGNPLYEVPPIFRIIDEAEASATIRDLGLNLQR